MIFDWLSRRSKTVDQIAQEIDGQGGTVVAGQPVTEKTALDVTTVMACVEVIADGIAVPEMHVMRDIGGGKKEKATDDPIYRVLNRRPNEWQTSFEFREMLTMHMALTGNAYAIPLRHPTRGTITEIWPVVGSMVSIQHVSRYGLRYVVHDEFGHIGTFAPHEILHFKNRNYDRIRGLGAVKTAARAIGLAMSSETNMEKLNENGGRAGGILSTDQKLGTEALERIRSGWKAVSTGKNAYKTAVLDNGMKYTPLAMSAADAQTLETRRMQVEEICRGFGVFPIMVGHSDKTATYASAEAFFAANNRKTVARWQRNWCEKLDEFALDGDGPLFVEFDNRDFQTASLRDQGDFLSKALGSGGGTPVLTQNEARELLGLPPVQGGDVMREPLALSSPNEGEDDAES